MENGTLVALTSLSSASIAGGITLISKWLDNKQKRNEQAMVIKTTFINKRIQAAESYIGRNSAGIASALANIRFFEHIKRVGNPLEQIIEYSQLAEKKEQEMTLTGNEIIELYFDIKYLIAEYTIPYNLLNKELDDLYKLSQTNSTDKFISDEKADYITKLLKEVLRVRREISKFLREDLAQYNLV